MTSHSLSRRDADTGGSRDVPIPVETNTISVTPGTPSDLHEDGGRVPLRHLENHNVEHEESTTDGRVSLHKRSGVSVTERRKTTKP